jgi:hypothetical protein
MLLQKWLLIVLWRYYENNRRERPEPLGAIEKSQALVRFRMNALPMVLQAELARLAVVQSSC